MPTEAELSATALQFADAVERLAFDMPPPNAYTPQFVSLAIMLRNAVHVARSTPDIARGEGADRLAAKARKVQAKVAAGELDLRVVGAALGEPWDQDFPAALLALAAAPNRAGGGE